MEIEITNDTKKHLPHQNWTLTGHQLEKRNDYEDVTRHFSKVTCVFEGIFEELKIICLQNAFTTPKLDTQRSLTKSEK